MILYEESVKKKKQNSNYPYSSLGPTIVRGLKETDYETIVEKRTINAPCDGILFFIESTKKAAVPECMDKFLKVYVVSYFDDYTEFCDWHEKIGIRKNSGG